MTVGIATPAMPHDPEDMILWVVLGHRPELLTEHQLVTDIADRRRSSIGDQHRLDRAIRRLCSLGLLQLEGPCVVPTDPIACQQKIGQNITATRVALGISKGECARRAKVSRPEISNLEAGRRTPRPATLRKIAAALECRPADLIAGLASVVLEANRGLELDRAA